MKNLINRAIAAEKRLLILMVAAVMAAGVMAQTDSVSTKSPTIDERLDNIEQRLEILDIDLSLKKSLQDVSNGKYIHFAKIRHQNRENLASSMEFGI